MVLGIFWAFFGEDIAGKELVVSLGNAHCVWANPRGEIATQTLSQYYIELTMIILFQGLNVVIWNHIIHVVGHSLFSVFPLSAIGLFRTSTSTEICLFLGDLGP